MAVQSQKLRMLYILQILMERTDEDHVLTASDIIDILREEYDVTCDRRTIYSEMETFQQFGIDIVVLKGYTPGYFVASRRFELPELKILVDTVQASRFISEKKSRELIGKLESLCSRHQAKQLSSQVTILNRPKTDQTVYYTVDKIHSAIYQDKKVTFQYAAWNIKKELVLRHGGTVYKVSPVSLTYDDENYYLIGYDEEAFRIKHYRVDKMQKLEITGESRTRIEEIEHFDLSGYAKKTVGMFGGEDTEVVLRGKNSLVGVVIDRFGKDIWIRPDGEDCFRARILVAVSPQFYGWVTGIGNGLEILSPEPVREEMKEYLVQILDQYKEFPEGESRE